MTSAPASTATGLRPYPAYKASGVEWLGDIPAHWEVARLKQVATSNDEVLPESTDPDLEINYVDIGGVTRGAGITEIQALTFGRAPSRARRVVRDGDVIISTVRTYLRAIASIQKPPPNLIVSTGFCVIRPRSLDSAFASHVLGESHFVDQVVAESTGANYPAIEPNCLMSIRTGHPPLSEQRRIGIFLDRETARIDAIVERKSRLIELLEEQKQAVIHQAVTGQIDVRTGRPYPAYKDSKVEWLGSIPAHWSVLSLRHRYEQCLGKMLDAKRITGDHLLPYLRNVDVQWNEINTSDLPLMDIHPTEAARYTLSLGDLLVCEGGEVGRCAIWRGEIERCGFQKALHRLRPLDNRQDDPRFLYYSFRVAANRGSFTDGHESTIAHLTGEKLRAHRFVFPPMDEQGRIARFLDKADTGLSRCIRANARQIGLAEEYRTRLISDVVTGKLDVREAAKALGEDGLGGDGEQEVLLETEDRVGENPGEGQS